MLSLLTYRMACRQSHISRTHRLLRRPQQRPARGGVPGGRSALECQRWPCGAADPSRVPAPHRRRGSWSILAAQPTPPMRRACAPVDGGNGRRRAQCGSPRCPRPATRCARWRHERCMMCPYHVVHRGQAHRSRDVDQPAASARAGLRAAIGNTYCAVDCAVGCRGQQHRLYARGLCAVGAVRASHETPTPVGR